MSLFGGGSGTASDPFLIQTKEHLDNIKDVYSVIGDDLFLKETVFQLDNDIDLGGATYNNCVVYNYVMERGEDDSFQDIDYYYFYGIFDGNGYSISNYKIDISTESKKTHYSGFFIFVRGQINNLSLSNFEFVNSTPEEDLTDRILLGGIFYFAYEAYHLACMASGILGRIYNCNIDGNINNKTVFGNNQYHTSGFVLGCFGSIEDCSFTGNLIANYEDALVGGIAGSLGYLFAVTPIELRQLNTSEPNLDVNYSIKSCSFIGDINFYRDVDIFKVAVGGICGLVGQNPEYGDESMSMVFIDCTFSGQIIYNGEQDRFSIGGIIGGGGYFFFSADSNLEIINCEVLEGSTITAVNQVVGGIVGHVDNDGTAKISNCFCGADIFQTEDGFGMAAGGIAGNFVPEFGGVIEDCRIGGYSTISGKRRVGGVAGFIGSGVTISNCVVEDCEIKGEDFIGGICGSIGGSEILNCEVFANLTSFGSAGFHLGTGGIFGSIYRASVRCLNSFFYGQITGAGPLGGIGGRIEITNESVVVINNCGSDVVIDVGYSRYAGGGFGRIEVEEFSSDRANNDKNIIIKNCYSKGMINHNGASFAGGFVGSIRGTNILLDHNYSDVDLFISAANRHVAIGGFVGIFSFDKDNFTKSPEEEFSQSIKRCYSLGSITTNESSWGYNYNENVKIAGFIGIIDCHDSFSVEYEIPLVSDCFSLTNIETTDKGNIAGFIGGISADSNGLLYIENSYYAGEISILGTASSKGFIYLNYKFSGDNILNCFWAEDLVPTGIDSMGGAAKDSTLLKEESTFIDAGWSFVSESENGEDGIWIMSDVSSDFEGFPIIYSPTTYEVRFKGGEHGHVTGNSYQVLREGEAAIEPSVVADYGWVFDSWDVSFNNILEDTIITALYVKDTFTVTFDAGSHGSIGTGSAVQDISFQEDADPPEIIADSGWKFSGWDESFIRINKEKTITALYIEDGDGSIDNPFLISTKEDLDDVNNDLSAYYRVLNDIDLSSYSYSSAVIAYSVGSEFTGDFDGNNYIISGLSINSTNDNVALFGTVGSGANIYNIGIEDCDIVGEENVGAIVGTLNGGSIEKSYILGNESSGVFGNSSVGSFCGKIENGNISNCFSLLNIEGNNFVGGFIGYYVDGNIKNSISINEIVGDISDGNSGGFIGYNDGEIYDNIINCFWDKQYSGYEDSFGGYGANTDILHENNFFLNSNWDFVGEESNGEENIWIMSLISGDFMGYPILLWASSFPSYVVSFFSGDYGVITEGKEVQVVKQGLSAEEPTVEAFEGWDFNGWSSSFRSVSSDLNIYAKYIVSVFTVTFDSGDHGEIVSGESVQEISYGEDAILPEIEVDTSDGDWKFIGWDINHENITCNRTITAQYQLNGDGSEEDPYLISNREDLENVNNDLGAAYKVIRDIDLSDVVYNYAVIGDGEEGADYYFTGIFDGNNHSISNLSINIVDDYNNDSYIGLFSVVSCYGNYENNGIKKGVIKNLKLESPLIFSSYQVINVGCMVGMIIHDFDTYEGNNIINCKVINGKIDSNYLSRAGLMVGYAEAAQVEFSSVSGLITADEMFSVGLFLGESDTEASVHNKPYSGLRESWLEGFIYRCFAKGNIISNTTEFLRKVGGFVGECDMNYEECYADVFISIISDDSSYIGGFAGVMRRLVSNCFAVGDVFIIDDESENIGGFCGACLNDSDQTNWKEGLDNSYFSGSLSCSSDDNRNGAFVGRIAISTIDSETCFWDKTKSSYDNSAYGVGKTPTQMKDETTFISAEWDFIEETSNGTDAIWQMSDSNSIFEGYPVLSWVLEPGEFSVIFDPAKHGEITSGNSIQTVIGGMDATLPTLEVDNGWTFITWDRDVTNIQSNIITTALYDFNVVSNIKIYKNGQWVTYYKKNYINGKFQYIKMKISRNGVWKSVQDF